MFVQYKQYLMRFNQNIYKQLTNLCAFKWVNHFTLKDLEMDAEELKNKVTTGTGQQETETQPTTQDNTAELEELRKYKADQEQANQIIMDALDAEPVLAKIIQDIVNGATFREAVARHIDPEDLVASEEDPDYEAWSKNKELRISELNKRKEFEETMSKNREMTAREIRDFATEQGMVEEQAIEFLGKVDELFSNVYAGLIDRKTLAFLKKAIDADQMVEEARQEGEIAGRNAKITEKIAPSKVGDGLPKVAASEDVQRPEPPVKKKGYIERLMSEES